MHDTDSLKSQIDLLENKLSALYTSNPSSKEIGTLAREQRDLKQLLSLYENIAATKSDISNTEEILKSDDSELLELASAELAELNKKLIDLEAELKSLTLIKLPDDEKSCIIEIRSGTGGTEAALFAEDLLRMYTRFANAQGWQVSNLHMINDDEGGIKTAIIEINQPGSYRDLRFESGVHRVQRVPSTESAGRIHTSAASVVVMPQIDEPEVLVRPEDVRIDVYRSSGPGGQSVNTTDSAVRLTHIPTGIVVTCQDGKSQLKNKEKAMGILAARLRDMELSKLMESQAEFRSTSIKSGDRSAKIRTYNFPQTRITDHRINKSWHNLFEVMNGELTSLLKDVQTGMRD